MAAHRKKLNASDLKALRYKRGMNQHEFWAKVGGTQSGGWAAHVCACCAVGRLRACTLH